MRGGVGGITVHLSGQGGQVAECRKRLEVIFDLHIIKRVGRLYIYERWVGGITVHLSGQGGQVAEHS